MPKTRRDSRKTGIWPLSYLGVEPVSPPLLLTDNRAPTTQDYKNFNVGTLWIDRSTAPIEDVWILVNKDNNVARWLRMNVVVSPLETLTGDVGGAVSPDALQNIDILGSGPYIFTGNPAAWSLTLSDDGTIATQYDGDTGSAVPAAGVLNILGGTNATTVAGGNTVTINIDGTVASSYVTDAGTATPAAGVLNVLGGELIGTTGVGNTVTANLDRGTDGQVIIGATGATSAYANITSIGGTLTISNGPNTINLEVAGGGPVTAGDNINISAPAVVNLNETIHWPYTNAAGTSGMIYLGGAGGVGGLRFLHDYSGTIAVSGSASVFLGQNSGNLTHTTSTDYNTGIGNSALRNLTTGASNTAVGDETLTAVTSGTSNVAIGDDCLDRLTTGSFNVGIGGDLVPGTGVGTGVNYTSAESSNIVISNPGVVGESNTIRLGTHGAGNGQQSKCFIAGIRGVATGVADAVPVLIDSAYQLGTVSSSIRYKQNVNDMGCVSSSIFDLRPVTFEYKSHPEIQQYGLIAEEVELVMPRLVVKDSEGIPETVKYHELIPMLLNEIQKLNNRISQLEVS
jgi:hypothetical protein